MNNKPPLPQSDDALLEAQRIYRRTLGAWISDLLALRRAGLDVPYWRDGLKNEAASPRRAA